MEPPPAMTQNPVSKIEAPVLETAAPAEEPATTEGEKLDGADGRDRRGRRSRRRRSRGRGFPDSKYAGPEVRPTPPESLAEPQLEEVEKATASDDRDFPVLPGESLAKYRRSGIQPLDEQEEEEIRGAHAELEAEKSPLADTETAPANEEPAPSAPEPLKASVLASAAGASFVREYETMVPDLEPEEEALLLDEPPAEEAEAEAEAEEQIAAEAEAAALSEPCPKKTPSLEVSAADAAQAAAEAALESEETQETSPESVEGESAGESGAPASGSGEQLSANVREQGGRYMHRMPRRMRRKMRGGGGPSTGEPRPANGEQDRRGEVVSISAVTEATVIVKPETPRVQASAALRKNCANLSPDHRTAERRPGDHRPDRQGAAGPKGRAHHLAYRAARPLRGLHADARAYGRFAQDRQRRRAPAAEEDPASPSRRLPGRLHRPHGGRRQDGRRDRRRHELPLQPVAGHPP